MKVGRRRRNILSVLFLIALTDLAIAIALVALSTPAGATLTDQLAREPWSLVGAFLVLVPLVFLGLLGLFAGTESLFEWWADGEKANASYALFALIGIPVGVGFLVYLGGSVTI